MSVYEFFRRWFPTLLTSFCIIAIFVAPGLVGFRDTIIYFGGVIFVGIEPALATYVAMKISLPNEKVSNKKIAYIALSSILFGVVTILLVAPLVNSLVVYQTVPAGLINDTNQLGFCAYALIAGAITAIILFVRWDGKVSKKS